MIISSAFNKVNRTLIFSLALLIGLLPTITSAKTAVATADKTIIALSKEEREWLKQNPVIRLGNGTDWAPIGFINEEGVYSGIAADYMKTIEELLSVTLEPAYLKPWKATVEAARKGEVDMLDSVAPTPQRKKFLSFTKPYLSYPLVIITQNNVPYIGNMSELNGQRVAVTAGAAVHDLLKNNHPEYELIPVKNAKAGLIEVKNAEVSAFIGNLQTTSHIISHEGITGLKVAGETPYRYELSIAVNKNKSILASILQKALNAIPKEKHHQIYRKWMSVTFEHKVDYTRFTRILALIIFIFVFILFWSRHRQVKKLVQEVEYRETIEEALRDRDVRVAAIVDTVIDSVITINTNGIIESFNPAAESTFGYDASDVIGKNVKILMPGAYQDKHDENLIHYLETGKAKIIGVGRELEAIRSDGSVFPMELSVSEMWIGEQQKFTGVIRDITERKQAEDALRESEASLNKAQKIAHLASWEWNVSSGVIKWSDEQYRMFGLEPGQIQPSYDYYFNAIHEEDRDAVQAALDKALSGEAEYHSEFRIIKEDGEELIVNASGIIERDNNGNPLRMVGTTQDVTDRKLAEKELQKHQEHLEELVQQRTSELSESNILLASAKEQAESASRSKSAFLANMSHELRTPLNVILGYAYILQNDATIYSGHKEKIKSIERSGQHLLEQISDILDVAKIEANKIELIPAAVNIKHYINYICSYFASHVEAKGIDLICIVDESVNPAIQVDERRLQQILLNLIGNAINFTEKGKVVVKIEPCKPVTPLSEKECCLRFSVEDTGIGIAEQDQEQIFLPFVQLKKKNHKGEGTGLGLNIALQLVKLMDGELKVESEVNKGSCFWFDLVLPVSEETKESYITKKEMPIGYHGKKRKILAVDDMKDSREVTRDMLTRLGFQVVVTSKGLDAVIIARDTQPDLILMDLLMPGINGYESLTTLRNVPECKNIPVVAMSASIGEEQPAMLAGFDHFLSKPTIPERLVSVLGEFLNLEWEYKTDHVKEKDSTLVPPPVSELKKLKKMAELGKMQRIIEWADSLENNGLDYEDFISHVRNLATEIRDDELIALLKRYLN